MLSCVPHRIQIMENFFWVEFERQDLRSSPSRENVSEWSAERKIRTFRESLPTLFATGDLLRSIPVAPEFLSFDPSRGQANRRYSHEYLRQAAAIFGTEILAPVPEKMPVVFCHGDALLKNMVLTPDGYRLIDWEDTGPSFWGADLAHAAAWMMLRLDIRDWPELIETSENEIAGFLGISPEQWRLLVFWILIGELVFWRTGEDLSPLHDAAAQLLVCD